MKNLIAPLLLAILMSCGTTKTSNIATPLKEQPIFKAIAFPVDEPDKIYLDRMHAFNYRKIGNDFIISDLNNNRLINGVISWENDQWKSVIEFIDSGKKFHNNKIVGRNDLMFKLSENNVITKDFKLDSERLLKFIEEYNEL